MSEAQAGAKEELVVYGTHTFDIGADDHGVEDGAVWIRLSRFGWTPCAAGEAQGLRAYMVNVVEEEGGSLADALPSGFGLIAGKGGDIIGFVTAAGEVRTVSYRGDGSSGSPKARMSMFSLSADESFEGRAIVGAPWDSWAMGRPVES